MVKLEKHILKEIKDYLGYTGWRVIRQHQSLGSEKGISDLIAIKDIITLFIEIKTEKGRLSKYQEAFKKSVEEKGFLYITARQYEDVEIVIKNLQIIIPDKLGQVSLTIQPIKGMKYALLDF